MCNQPDYVNKWPKGTPEGTPKCQYVFQQGDTYEGLEVEGHPCGLPARYPPWDHHRRRGKALCYFHERRARYEDTRLKPELVEAVRRGDYLGEAYLVGAKLAGTDLRKARLHAADLSNAVISSNKHRTNLQGADLGAAHLQRADLRYALLQRANLIGAELHSANLNEAHLKGSDLRGALLSALPGDRDVDLVKAHLEGALLTGARVVPTTSLAGAFWGEPHGWRWSKYHLEDERWLRDPNQASGRKPVRGPAPTFADCANIYRELRIAYQRTSDQETESAFFIREMECHRAQMDAEVVDKALGWCKRWFRGESTANLRGLAYWFLAKPTLFGVALYWLTVGLVVGLLAPLPRWVMSCTMAPLVLVVLAYLVLAVGALLRWKWAARVLESLGWWLMYYLAGYAEWPGHVMAWAAAVWVSSFLVLWWRGCANGEPLTPLNALYASTINLTSLNAVTDSSLGVGFTASSLFKVVASIESVCGIVLAALFIACLVRKFSR